MPRLENRLMLPNSNSAEVEAKPTWEIILSENMFTVAVRRYESSDWLSERWRPSELIQQVVVYRYTILPCFLMKIALDFQGVVKWS